jgi:hypothetical protein
MRRIHRAEHIIARHLSVKCRYQTGKAFFANLTVNLTF